MKIAQFKIDDLQEWFFKIAQRLSQPLEESPYPSPKKVQAMSPVKTRPFYSPDPSPSYRSGYAQSSSIFGFKEHSTESTNFNAQPINNTSHKDIPTDWLLKFVLLCV